MDAKGFVPGQGPVWDMGPGRSAALKMQNGETAEKRDDVRGSRAARHREAFHPHHDSDELTYVLSGEITFKIGDEVTVGGPGTCAFMPHGVADAWKNAGRETGRALFLYTPAGAGKLFEDLRRAQCLLSSMDDGEVAEIFRRCRWEVVGPPPF